MDASSPKRRLGLTPSSIRAWGAAVKGERRGEWTIVVLLWPTRREMFTIFRHARAAPDPPAGRCEARRERVETDPEHRPALPHRDGLPHLQPVEPDPPAQRRPHGRRGTGPALHDPIGGGFRRADHAAAPPG